MKLKEVLQKLVRGISLVILFLPPGLFFLQYSIVHAANPAPIQVFFLSMPEDQVFASFKKISSTAPAAPMHSVTSISITTSSTQIYYDQWENGYEVDLANPSNLYSTSNLGGTQIWGNHLAADGCPPNIDGKTSLPCSDANDVLTLGNVIVLENDIPLPRTSSIYYDGRDKLGGTKVIAVTRSVWAATPGTVLADAVEVYDTTRWGIYYEMPVGENTTNNPQNATITPIFNYSSVVIIAAENGTSVTVDKDGPGATAPVTVTLNQGDSYQVDGGMKMGGTVTSTKPVQANLLTGTLASKYASRWYSLPPQTYWTDSLWTSVGTTVTNYPSTVFIYNPSDSTAMTVNYETKLGTGTFSVPANGTYRFEMPVLSGAHFYTNGVPFQAVGGMDASLSGADATYDWGFTLVPDTWLTTGFIAGWAPGNATYTGNGSPVWVTAIQPTTIYVDYGAPSLPGPFLDPKGRPYDVAYQIGKFESKQIVGVNNTQTGIKVWTADGTSITGAWGEDPKTAAAGTPYLDVGYTIPPLPEVVITKQADLATDINSNGLADPGDTLLYTLTVRNAGAVTAFNVAITDAIPAHTSYVAGSTRINNVLVADNPSFPLLGSGILIPSINVGSSVNVTYKMKTDLVPPSAPYPEIVNTAYVTIDGDTLTVTLRTPIASNATACTVGFTDSSFASNLSVYQKDSQIYIQISDMDQNKNPAVAESIASQVVDLSTSDREALTLTESGIATGIFRVILPGSSTAGQTPDDGTLYAQLGDTIQITFTDPVNGDTCNASATIVNPTLTKQLYLSDPSQSLDRVDPVNTSDASTSESGDLATGSSGAITIGGTTTGASSTGVVTSLTFSHTPGSGSNRLLLVSVATGSSNNTNAQGTVTGVTFNGNAMTLVGSQVIAGWAGQTTNTNGYIYMLKDADLGTTSAANVVVTTTSSTVIASATTFNEVSQSSPLGTYQGYQSQTSGGSNTLALNSAYSSAAGQVVYSFGSADQGGTAQTITTNPGQTQLWNSGSHQYVIGAASTMAGALTVDPRYGLSNARRWTLGVVAVKPASGSSGNPTTTFTLAPALASSLSIPANATITVPLYLNVTSGSMPANPNITAVIKYGTSYASATTLKTLTSPSYSGGLLTFTGASPASVTTIPSGNNIYLDVTTAESSISFKIQYDSSSYPSKINLPTTTYIKVDSLDIYDAPYPGGALISNPASGQTVYIRSSISDPFGYADITSSTLDITDPSSVTTTQNSTGANIVSSSGASRIFEFPWVVPSKTGSYTLKITGKEGYENSVTDSRASQVTVAFQDTGTPSKIEFTNTPNGTAVTSYDPASDPADQICLRVSDFDQNLNINAMEMITVKLNSSKGDAQTVTLTETGNNTGIFVNCVTREIALGGSEPDGQIYALAGDLLSVNYVDPNDPADISSAIAVLTTNTSTLTLVKSVASPSNLVAVVGETIRFDIMIANPNANSLTSVTLADAYPASCFEFKSASLAPDDPNANPLIWSNVGPIASHESKTISLSFTARAVCTSAAGTNVANASAVDSLSNNIPATGTVTSSAGVTISQPGIAVTKTIKAGSPNPSQLGQDVTFAINILNSGTTNITTLPLTDTYSAYCLSFKSATNGGSGSGGVVSWSNLGPLASGNSLDVEVTFTSRGVCANGTNRAIIDSAYDTNGDSVPTAQNSINFTTQVLEPSITKTFSPMSVKVGDVTTLSFTITNPNLYGSLTGISFTDTYPAGLVNDDPLVTTNNCSGGTLAAIVGGGSFSYTDGTVPANSSCVITVKVKAAGSGPLNNSVSVSSSNGLTGASDTDSLDTQNLFDPPSGFKSFSAAGLPVMVFRMVWINNGSAAAINVQVTDDIPAGTTYVPGSVTCSPQGTSSTAGAVLAPLNTALTACDFDSTTGSNGKGRIQWQGIIQPDPGIAASDPNAEALAQNEVVITFQVTVDANVNQINNVASSRTDTNADTLFTDETTAASSSSSNMAIWNRFAITDPGDPEDLPDELPKTGFAPNVVTSLPEQPTDKLYRTTDVWLEIPSLDVKMPIVGVPLADGEWNLSWLWNEAGWLEGTAFPSWQGNSVLTGHVTLPNGQPGPFASLSALSWGDHILVHAYGTVYTYEVRQNQTISPYNKTIYEHEVDPWLTLITCASYNDATGTYSNRIAVSAVLTGFEKDRSGGFEKVK